MWVVADYEATTLFSLKPASATSSGGRTLLVPTPFAIKMALLDVVCRVEGVAAADGVCEWLSAAQVAIRPPRRIVVNNTFMRVLKPWEFKGKAQDKEVAIERAKEQRKYPFATPNIAYREFAQYGDSFAIALQVEEEDHAKLLQGWLMVVNYLGKRGSFMQVQDVPARMDELGLDFIVITGDIGESFQLDSIMTQLDDTSADLTFEKASVYSGKRITLGKERLLHHVVLPYRLVSSSRGYSYYEVVP